MGYIDNTNHSSHSWGITYGVSHSIHRSNSSRTLHQHEPKASEAEWEEAWEKCFASMVHDAVQKLGPHAVSEIVNRILATHR